MSSSAATYLELLTRLEEYRQLHNPAQIRENAVGEPAAMWGKSSPPTDTGAELLLAPMHARGRRIGKIDVVIPTNTELHLRHNQRLLRELAVSAALAIDTADYLAQCTPTPTAETAPTSGQAVDLILSLLAHDLRTPLTSLSSSVQMLVRELKGSWDPNIGRLARLIEIAEAAVAQLETQVNALSLTPRAGALRSVGADEPIDLVMITRLMANFYQQTTEQHTLIVASDVAELYGHWTRAHIERVLGNMLLNAIKYCPDGGDIQIGVSYDEDALGRWATLSVQNHGPGIPLQDFPQLSQPGYRARNVGPIPGTGFGLASVREVVELHGGSFAIQSAVGGSTTVLVRLPI
ncbi:MAG: sensor histidine kinase [Oscillochloridaceae bacterium umkhey_bin13]